MPISLADAPPILYRIGRAPDPLTYPPLARMGDGRYDDPLGRVSTLYASEDRVAAYFETLDQFRLDLEALADRNAAVMDRRSPEFEDPSSTIPAFYFTRLMVEFGITPGLRCLDVRKPETHTVLRHELALQLSQLGLRKRFVLGDILAHDHRVTQLIARWAIDNAFDGIAYSSCHDPSLTCWAIFEGVDLIPLGQPEPITTTDPDLLAVARLWDLRIPD
jgi:hypothetical protein